MNEDNNMNLPNTGETESTEPVATPIPEAEPYTEPELEPCENTPELSPAEATPEASPLEAVPEAAPIDATPEMEPAETTPELTPYNTPRPQAPVSTPYTQPVGGTYSTPPYTPPYSAPYTASAATPTPAPKKKSTGAKVMLICLWVLLGLFSAAIIGTCGYFMGINDGNEDLKIPGIIEEDDNTPVVTEPTSVKETEAPDYSYLYDTDGEIVLNNYPSDKDNSEKYTTQSAYEKVSPSTVGIMCYANKDKESLQGQGTGIVVSNSGYIATNSHVIGDSKSAYIIDVVLENGNIYEAQVVGYDTRTDLAVLKITASGLKPAEFADSKLLSIGEDVIAVGNPGGIEFQNTLTRGIVSAKDRTLGLSTQVSYIQTDAAINPGNSGGPLCNLYGQVVGINSAKIASSEYEGMGFAIPSRTVKEVVDDLIKQGYVSDRVKIGITGTAITASQAEYNNVPMGILISEITKGGPCDNGEVMANDIIVSLDDFEITSFNEIYTALATYTAGDEVTLRLYRMETEEYIETVITLQADDGSTTQE